MGSSLSVRLPDGTAKALRRLAGVLERPKSFLIVKALEAYLAETVDYEIAIGRLKDKDDTILSSKEFRKSVGL